MQLGTRIISILILIVLAGSQCAIAQQFAVKKVVIDAGHGGHDSGCLGPKGSKEKHVALAIALELGKMIEKYLPEVEVIYTRTTDVFVELRERADIANRNRADLFICIHCNAASSREAYGAETYFLGLHKTEANLDVAKRENSVIKLEDNYQENYNGFDPNSPEWHIAMALNVSAYMEQSALMAQHVQEEFTGPLKRHDRGVRQAGFLVLHQTAMPSVLIETGFLTNPKEEIFLSSKEGQRSIAKGIFNAFVQYKSQMEGTKPLVQLPYDAPSEEPEENDIQVPAPVKQDTLKKSTVVLPTPKSDKFIMVKSRKIWYIQEILPKNSTAYLVQLMASTSPSPAQLAILDKVELLCVEKLPNGVTRYLAGPVFTQNEAWGLKKKLQSLGFTDAFLGVYQDGSRLSPEDAKKYLTAN